MTYSGGGNFVGDIIWEKRYGRSNDARLMASVLDHILLYRKSDSIFLLREPRTEKIDSAYTNPDNDPRGPWTSVSFVSQRTRDERPNLSYEIINPYTGAKVEHPTNAWKYNFEKYQAWTSDNRFYWGKDGTQNFPRIKRFLSELSEGLVPVNLWKHQDAGTGDEGTKEVNELVGKTVFNYPKPLRLIKRMLGVADSIKSDDNIILDFFSGSATTAHAVMKLNAEDGGNRKYIMVQIPEKCDEKSEAYKAGYKTIAEIGKERIRRAGEKIKAEMTEKDSQQLSLLEDKAVKANLDIGFKVFKLDETNFTQWDEETTDPAGALLRSVQSIKPNRASEDALYEILLKYGIDLTLPVTELEIDSRKVFSLAANYLLVCLEKNLSLSTIEEIAKLKPQRVVFYDDAFKDDVVKLNAEQTLRKFGVEDVRVI